MGQLLHLPTRGLEPWMTKHKVAAYYDVSEKTVRRWAARGCPHRRFGNRLRFRISDVESWHQERSA